MTYDAVLAKTLTRVCPGTKDYYETHKAPPLPWFAYSHQRGEEFFADDSNYARLPRYRVELLFKENDPELVGRFEDALDSLGTWTLYSDDMNEAEHCYVHDYRLALNPGKYREGDA